MKVRFLYSVVGAAILILGGCASLKRLIVREKLLIVAVVVLVEVIVSAIEKGWGKG